MRFISEADAIRTLPSLLKEARTHSVVISHCDEEVAALVWMEDYEIRRTKADRLLRTMDEFGEQIRRRAAADGLTPDDLMRLLDRKAS